MAITITGSEHTGTELRTAAGRTQDAAAARRMLALAMVLEGRSRAESAESCGMDRQTLRDWVHRYNAEGLAGLCDRDHPGRPPRLTMAQKAELGRMVEVGPDLASDRVVRWRCAHLHAVIKKRFGGDMGERTLCAVLHKLRFRRLSART